MVVTDLLRYNYSTISSDMISVKYELDFNVDHSNYYDSFDLLYHLFHELCLIQADRERYSKLADTIYFGWLLSDNVYRYYNFADIYLRETTKTTDPRHCYNVNVILACAEVGSVLIFQIKSEYFSLSKLYI